MFRKVMLTLLAIVLSHTVTFAKDAASVKFSVTPYAGNTPTDVWYHKDKLIVLYAIDSMDTFLISLSLDITLDNGYGLGYPVTVLIDAKVKGNARAFPQELQLVWQGTGVSFTKVFEIESAFISYDSPNLVVCKIKAIPEEYDRLAAGKGVKVIIVKAKHCQDQL